MKKLFIALLFIGFSSLFGQENLEFQFDQARALLAQREVEPAIDALRYIYAEDSANANINFLMGAAYTELSGHQNEALFHLKKAVQNVNMAYKVGSFQETGAPLHVYYYLTIAYVENDQCALANQANQEFKKYKGKVDDYFIAEADRHLQKCPFVPDEDTRNWNQMVEAPSGYNPSEFVVEEEKILDSAALAERGMLIQKLEYTTNAPLYGVQIGSNINPSPISSFGNIKNVDVFVDNKGLIRYVVGHFSYYSQAESLLKSLRDKGYADAFIVNVNDERKYSNELISYRNINLRAGIVGEVQYYIQLGAFEEEIPNELLDAYTTLENVEEIKYKNLTIMGVGPFKKYDDAIQEQELIKSNGFNEVFIVAFNKGKKIPLEEAINHTD
tara:strand:+ start:14699 stop:15856 length:1158 start_codon:yes stop_codon:yes gene_type:complete